MDGRIFHIIQKLRESLDEPWTIDDMARSIDLSPQHFIKLFKQNTGSPPASYLAEIRLDKARELIETTFLQMKQIGFQTGLTNDSHFTRNFKKTYGLSPVEYRKRHWEIEQSNPPNEKK